MKKFFLVFIVGIIFLFSQRLQAACTLEVEISSAISAASLDYFERGLEVALEKKCESILILINTPGGNLQSTRMIVEKILASPIPIMCVVAPQGGHAGSAGAIILQACHLSGALKATNIGAATPIQLNGELPEDVRNKMINDTSSWVQGLAKLRGRSLEFAKKIVTEAQSLDSQEAFKQGAIEIVSDSVPGFLLSAQGRKTTVKENTDYQISVGDLIEFKPDWRYKILDFTTDPQISYMIFMGSIALLYIEFTTPGVFLPGILGSVGLIFSLISFHKLEVVWGGVLLIILGIGLLIAEAFITSFGILGLGGFAALILGSSILFDPKVSGYSLPWSVILAVVIPIAIVFFASAWLIIKDRKRKKVSGVEAILEKSGKVVSLEIAPEGYSGKVEVQGEIWNFECQESLQVGDEVKVLDHKGFKLTVKKL